MEKNLSFFDAIRTLLGLAVALVALDMVHIPPGGVYPVFQTLMGLNTARENQYE